MNCSPNNIENLNYSCFDKKSLIAMTKAFNKWNSLKSNQSETRKAIENIDSLSEKELYNELNKRLSHLCSDEYCWADLDFIDSIKNTNLKNKIKYFTFKPKGTLKSNTWLDTENINQIIEQYELSINNKNGQNFFLFLGAQPSDFTKLYKINYQKLQKNYKNLAIVFNNDTHDKSGSHWVCCFINNLNKTVEYFDSLGKLPNKNIQSFLNKFKGYQFRWNNIKHQKGGPNCGIYCCYFIIQKLMGKTFTEINTKVVSDNMMRKYRKQLFRKPSEI